MTTNIKKPTIKDIINQIGGDETFTKKRIKKKEEYNTVRDNIRLEEDAALMNDVLELPSDKKGFHYCLVCTDIASREFDIEPMKNKTSEAVLTAFKKMISRNYIDIPKYYMISDKGREFYGV